MKKIFPVVFIFLFFSQSVLAATSTGSAEKTTVTPTPGQQKIQELKDRLATFTAQQKQTETKAIFGTVKSISVSNFVVETETKEIKIDLRDNIKVTQMINGKRTNLTTEDIAKGDVVTVFGDYEANIDLIKAKIVVIQNKPPLFIVGAVTGINRTEYTETVVTPDNQTYTVDIETDTKTNSWSAAKGIFRMGFSKADTGDFVVIVASTQPKQPPTRVSARRILDLGNLTGPTVITPTGNASPSAIPKTTPKPTQN